MKRNQFTNTLILSAIVMMALSFTACKNNKQAPQSPSQEPQQAEVPQPQEQQAEEQVQQPAVALTYADVAGIYDSFTDEGSNESRIGLLEDGTATWNMIGSLNFTEFNYTIKGDSICLTDVDDDSDCGSYYYDREKKTLSNSQGEIYYFQDNQ